MRQNLEYLYEYVLNQEKTKICKNKEVLLNRTINTCLHIKYVGNIIYNHDNNNDSRFDQ